MSVCWTLAGSGWIACTVADDHARAELTASYVTAAPEHLLAAVTRMVLGETEARAQFEAEPTAFRWLLHRAGNSVGVEVVRLPDGRRSDSDGTLVWSSRQSVDTVARAIIRGFDDLDDRYGEDRYLRSWGSPFPRSELEHLRNAWKTRRGSGM